MYKDLGSNMLHVKRRDTSEENHAKNEIVSPTTKCVHFVILTRAERLSLAGSGDSENRGSGSGLQHSSLISRL
jgi:hypothetical protein